MSILHCFTVGPMNELGSKGKVKTVQVVRGIIGFLNILARGTISFVTSPSN
jgi:hypothetical protein